MALCQSGGAGEKLGSPVRGQPFFRLPSFFNLFTTLEKNENSSLDARQKGDLWRKHE